MICLCGLESNQLNVREYVAIRDGRLIALAHDCSRSSHEQYAQYIPQVTKWPAQHMTRGAYGYIAIIRIVSAQYNASVMHLYQLS